ncbi:MAG: glycosyltransferase [Alphaproteobacteria bacterium]|nr:glycosyltransferase [Alphaproteobacteria bacterium]
MVPKVSVVLPVFNADDILGNCLDSVLFQTLSDFEVICVDLGSSDNTFGVLSTYAMLDNRVKVISKDKISFAEARNEGIKCAQGEFVAFLEQDNVYATNNVLETLYEVAKLNDANVCMGECAKLNLAQGKVYQPFKEDSGLIFKANMWMDYEYCQFDEGYQRGIYNRSFLNKNHICFNQYAFGDTSNFLVHVMQLAKKFYALHKVICVKVCNPQEIFHWTKEKVVSRWKSIIDNLKIADTNNYHQLKNSSLIKLQEFFPVVMKFCENETERLDLLRMTAFLYADVQAKVSIIVPVYNEEKYLRHCLDSLVGQTLKEIEIICVDDGSQDASLAILKEYADKDSRITVLTQMNQKQGVARETALKKASGEYIQYVDADDAISQDCSEYLYLYSKLYRLDMLMFETEDCDEKTGEKYKSLYTNFAYLNKEMPPVFAPSDAREFLPKMAVCACLTFYRKEFLDINSIHWTNCDYEDTLFFTESVLQAERMGILKENLYFRTMHADSTIGCINSNYGGYCDVLHETFKVVKELSSPKMLSYYISWFLTKAYNVLNIKLLPDARTKFTPKFYKLCVETMKKYHVRLPKGIEEFVARYTLKHESFYKKISYFWTLWRLNIIRDVYEFSLFSFKRYTGGFVLKILGVPVFFKKPPKYHKLLSD